MTFRAWVGNFVLVSSRRSDNGECVGTDKDAGDGALDFRHVTRDALTSRRIRLVMRVLFNCGRVWTIERHRRMAI